MDTPTGITICGYSSINEFFMFGSFNELINPTIMGLNLAHVQATLVQNSINQTVNDTAPTIQGRVKVSTGDTRSNKVVENILT